MNDEQAMWRGQMQNDNAAFVELLQRWEQPIVRFCARMTGDPHRPEDVLKVDCDEDGGGDDAADALRYLVASKGRMVT